MTAELLVDRNLTYRRIDPARDGELAYSNYRKTCQISFGHTRRCLDEQAYLHWLTQRVEEYPDGHVMALLGSQIIGQLELQIPYGLDRGYVNLFYVEPEWRRLGFGRRLHEFALQYFRSWEGKWVELHVSATNQPAVRFYQALGYRRVGGESGRMWLMERAVEA